MKAYVIQTMTRFRARFHLWTPAAFVLAICVVYALLFIPLYRMLGPVTIALTILPVVVVGWLLGMWASLLASVFFLLTLLLHTVAGGEGGAAMIRTSLLGFCVTVVSGAMVGRLRDLSQKLRQQIAEREQADELLVCQASDLARSNAFITALSQATTRLGATLDPDQVMEAIGDELKRLGMTCMVAMLGSEEQALVIRYASIDRQLSALGEKLVGRRMQGFTISREHFPIWDELIEQQRAVFVPDTSPLMAAALPSIPWSVIEHTFKLGGWNLDNQVIWLPLTIENRVTGSLAVWGPDLQESDLSALTVFAGQVAVALENARLHVETQKRLQEQVALQEASTVISSTLDVEVVLTRIAEQLARAVDATSAYISTTDLETRESTVLAEYFSRHASAQERESDVGVTYREDDVGFLEALVAGKPYADHADDPGMQEDDREHMMAHGAQTALYIPLYVRGQAIGYAELWESRRRREFTPEEIGLCQAITQNATIAIENARLHAETEKRLTEQIALREAGTAITSALDLETVLTRIAEQMGRAIDSTSAYISRHEPETMTYTVIAEYLSSDAAGQERVSDLGATYQYEESDAEFIEAMESGEYDVSQADDLHLFEFERAHMQEYGARSILYIPLLVQDRLVGYAELWESRRRREFASEEIGLCQNIARQAAIALENTRLYEQAQQEIAERMRAEEQIKASLKEKEVLLQEIHHRVKNNLQVISSLLSLQASRIDTPGTLEVFRESQNRIRSMGLIHEQLYRSHDLACIDFGAYVRNLAAFLFRSYGADPGELTLEIEADEVSLGIDQAVPCGLILNELMSNALKHAFPAGRGGEIRVALGASDDKVTLMVSDSGVGLPTGLDYRATTSLGLQLVSTLVDQLDGEIELENRNGTSFKLIFSIPS